MSEHKEEILTSWQIIQLLEIQKRLEGPQRQKRASGIPFGPKRPDIIPLRESLRDRADKPSIALHFGRSLVTDESGVVRLADLPPVQPVVVSPIAAILKKP